MKNLRSLLAHSLIWLCIVFLCLPLYVALVAASHPPELFMQGSLPLLPGGSLLDNLSLIFSQQTNIAGGLSLGRMLVNSLLVALLLAVGKIVFALLASFALIFFELPFKKTCFALIFATMLLPIEVRIVPSFQIIASFGWLNSFAGLSLPLMASATATFLFRQFFKTFSKELVDAAKLDGAGPYRFFFDILLPLSKTQVVALFITLFVYGWNQYLWPLLVTTDSKMATVVMGIHYLVAANEELPQWSLIMLIALIALIPPCLLIMLMQRYFEKGVSH